MTWTSKPPPKRWDGRWFWSRFVQDDGKIGWRQPHRWFFDIKAYSKLERWHEPLPPPKARARRNK